MTTVVTALSPVFAAGAQFFDDDGIPLAGGYLYTYSAGTTTPAVTYPGNPGTVGSGNPVPMILDAAGRLTQEVWLVLGSSYKFVLKDANGVEVWTYDNITVYQQTNALTALADATTITNGDALVAFKQSNGSGILTGAVARTVHAKLQESVSVKDFGAVGDGTTDDAAAISQAIRTNRRIYFPAGTYLIKSGIRVTGVDNFSLVGDGIGVSIIKCDSTVSFTDNVFTFDGCEHIEVRGLTINCDNTASLKSGDKVAMYLNDCGYWQVDSCEFKLHPYIGLYASGGTYWWLTNNLFFAAEATGTRVNYNFNIAGGGASFGTIQGNQSYLSPCIVVGKWIVVDSNIFAYCKYGAGFTSGDQPVNTGTCGNYIISNNISVANTGFDKDYTDVAGMEIDGWFNTVVNNYCSQNGGVGIALIGKRQNVHGNTCLGNGTNVSSSAIETARTGTPNDAPGNPGRMPYYNRAGIKSYQLSTYGASYSSITGNLCADLGANSQYYGYAEETSALIEVTLAANDFTSNYGAPTLIQSSQGAYHTSDWTSFTPTITASGGSITATAAAKYKLTGREVKIEISIYLDSTTITTQAIYCTLPTILGGAVADASLYGINVTTKAALSCYLDKTNARLSIMKYDGSASAGATGATLQINGSYRTN